jgi:hypothetical protein
MDGWMDATTHITHTSSNDAFGCRQGVVLNQKGRKEERNIRAGYKYKTSLERLHYDYVRNRLYFFKR